MVRFVEDHGTTEQSLVTHEMYPGQLANYQRRNTIERCHLWRVFRQDGVEHRFTDHDQPVSMPTVGLFRPAPGIKIYSRRASVGLVDRTTELRGIVDDTQGIPFDDLRSGRFRDARIHQRKISWRHPVREGIFAVWFVNNTNYTETEWVLELGDVTSKLRAKQGEVISGTCSNELGVNNSATSFCKAVITAYPSTVTAAAITSTLTPSARVFTIAKSGGQPLNAADGFFDHGFVRGITGRNAGKLEMIQNAFSLSGTEQSITLANPLPFVPVVGETFDLVVGCNKLADTCDQKFGQLQTSFRGEPHVPGFDAVIRTPSAT